MHFHQLEHVFEGLLGNIVNRFPLRVMPSNNMLYISYLIESNVHVG